MAELQSRFLLLIYSFKIAEHLFGITTILDLLPLPCSLIVVGLLKEISASATALHDSIDSLAGKMKDTVTDKIDAPTPSADLVDNNLQIMLDRSQLSLIHI